MNASPQHTHDPGTCLCHACQTARYERQFGPAPTVLPPGHAAHPGYAPPGPGHQRPPYYGPPPSGLGTECTVAALAHWLPAAVALVFGVLLGVVGVPVLGALLAPVPALVVFVTARSPFVREHGREALNFQLTVMMPALLFSILSIFTVAGVVLDLLLFVACLVPQILGAARAGTGEGFRYVVAIPFVPPTVAPGPPR